MKRFKGSTGKWKIMFIKNGTQRTVRNKGGIIATMWKPSRYEGQDERYENELTETKANAQLISYAPEMLEMLIESIRVVNILFEATNIETIYNETANYLTNAEKLIKEATEV